MDAGQKIKMPASILLITTLSLLVVGCKAARVPAQITSATAPSAQSEPTVSEIRSKGEDVNFEICGESTSWTRPSESDQDTKWWRSGRYAGLDEKAVKYPWTHGFFVAYGAASLEYDLINLSGLWTLPGDARTKCLEQSDTILKLQTAELWALYHRVKGITRLNTCYVVTVESVDTGVQFVHFSRPKDYLPMTLHFVDENGQEIDTIAEAENWPYPQLTLGAIPAACTPTAPSEPQKSRLRITNNGVVDVRGLTIIFPEDRIEFGDIPAGETSEYRDVPHGVFRYAAYTLQVNGNTIEQPVIDWVGERPMDGLAFTYAIEVDPNRSNWEVVRLTSVTKDE